MESSVRMKDDRGAAGSWLPRLAPAVTSCVTGPRVVMGTSLTSTEVRWIAFLLPGRVDSGEFPSPGQDPSFLATAGAGRCFGLPGPFPGGHYL